MGHVWNVPLTALQTNARPQAACVSLGVSAVVNDANAAPIRDRTAIPHNTTATDSDGAEPPPRFVGVWYRLGTMRTLPTAESRSSTARKPAERDEPE
jgi:hypothetical protein